MPPALQHVVSLLVRAGAEVCCWQLTITKPFPSLSPSTPKICAETGQTPCGQNILLVHQRPTHAPILIDHRPHTSVIILINHHPATPTASEDTEDAHRDGDDGEGETEGVQKPDVTPSVVLHVAPPSPVAA